MLLRCRAGIKRIFLTSGSGCASGTKATPEGRSGGCTWPGCTRPKYSLKIDELDVEDEHPGGGPRSRRLVAVGETARNPEPRLLALRHELEPLGPTLDDVAHTEARGLPPRDRAVEHLAVGRPA